MIQKEYDLMIRLMVLGDSGVGKSSMLNAYTIGSFKENQTATIGIDYKNKVITRNDATIKLQIWDTAGEERYHSITKISIRDVDAVILLYDITNSSTYRSIQNIWIDLVQNSCKSSVIIVLLGNKVDLADDRQVAADEAMAFAKENNFVFFESTAKNSNKVSDIFGEVVDRVMEKIKEGGYEIATRGIKLEEKNPDEKMAVCGPKENSCPCV